jgi:hypothetical protein
MPSSAVFFVGALNEVDHHAQPLREHLPVAVVDPAQAPTIAKAGDVAIFFSEHFDRFRECVRLLREKSVATLYAIDGILEWRNAWQNRADEPACPWTMRPALAHKVACIGRHQFRILRAWGNAEKVELIGLPRLDSLTANRFPTLPRASKTDGPFRLLVMTAKWPGFTPEQIARTRQSLGDLRDCLNANSKSAGRSIEVTWRLTGGLAEELNVANSLSNTVGGELGQLLSRVDAVITTPSTALLEAMLYGLPTASLDYHNVPSYVQPAWTITHPGAISNVIAELQNPSPSRLFYQQSLLRDELECDGLATARMVDLIQKMQAIARQWVAANKPLQFPPNLIPDPTAGVLEFPAAELFPQHAAFGETNPLSLQAELAHARREIILLQAEIAQLRSELDQAHQIFEQIHRHPIAGPVVRLRQKLLDKWEQLSQRKTRLEALEKMP